MIEKIGHIKNPLTVIAIFAGIAEISGTIVLPFVAPEIQKTYIWFLMLFPSGLVGIFFYTLHVSPESLYSPSDYKDEDNFLKTVRKITPQEATFKRQLEAKEVEADIENAQAVPAENDSPSVRAEAVGPLANHADRENLNFVESIARWRTEDYRARILSEMAAAEKLAVARLSKTLEIHLQTDVHLALDTGRQMLLDAFAQDESTIHLVEVKYYPTLTIDASRFYAAIEFAGEAMQHFSRGKKHVTLHVFIVSNANSEVLNRVKAELYGYALSKKAYVQIHSARLTDLLIEEEE